MLASVGKRKMKKEGHSFKNTCRFSSGGWHMEEEGKY